MIPKVTIKLSGLNKLIKKIDSFENSMAQKTILNRIGNKAKFFIVTRTMSGKDVDNKSFKPYTQKYSIFRREKKKRPVNKVNLFLSGRMLNALQYQISGKETVRLYFDDAGHSKEEGKPSLRAMGHNFGYKPKKLPQRKFFSLNQKEMDSISKEVEDFITEEIQKLDNSYV